MRGWLGATSSGNISGGVSVGLGGCLQLPLAILVLFLIGWVLAELI